MFFFLHLKYQFFKHQSWWQAHRIAGLGQNYDERPKSKFWTFFLIKSSMIVLKLAFPEPFLVTE